MAKGLLNNVIGYIWARRVLWLFLGWIALNLFFYDGFAKINNFELSGFTHIVPRILGILAIDVFRKGY